MNLTDEERKIVYAAMKVADAIVLEVTLGGDTPTSDKVLLWHPERIQQVIDAKAELREVSELPYKWKELMKFFDQMFAK